ncbi:hypothetical protein Misp01_41300 [Microtetraspora sp. NBRC 13810]|uniref:hypothetical protein n=1 Tax=Microtetraspora sp. NBRC 13810 TaxID=3030990 RepID=UPI00255315B8|nr:hypothetical protein [Microtetraspora sp. NBRC 13810]GLW09000.1 hypothetical protein Misp01_41300 [Microtetraspora sp. NBRC 13810]
MPSHLSVFPVRRSYALLYWWLAVALTASEGVFLLAVTVAPQIATPTYVGCVTVMSAPFPDWRMTASAWVGDAAGFLWYALPVGLALGAWLVARRGAGRPRVHLWAASAGVTLVAARYALDRAQDWLSLSGEMSCGVDPAAPHGVTVEAMAWAMAPAVCLLAGAWAGTAHGRPPWRRIGVIAVAVAVPVAAVTVVPPLLPYEPAGQVLGADGTQRYALVRSGGGLAVLDLVEGGEPEPVEAPDPEFHQYTAIVRDTVPGRYLAAVSTWGDGASRRSRIHRVDLDGDGGAMVRERVGGDVEGVVNDLAVSPGGRVAYSRLVASPVEPAEVGQTVVGLVGGREWSAPGGHGQGVSGDGDLGLHWRDADTLVFRARSDGDPSARLVALDVRDPGADLLAGRTLYTMDVFRDGTSLTVPGRSLMIVSQVGGVHREQPRLLTLEPPERTPGAVAFEAECGELTAFTLDPTGRYALVAVEAAYQGVPPDTVCGDVSPSRLFRVDLGGPPEPRAEPTAWEGEWPVRGLAW